MSIKSARIEAGSKYETANSASARCSKHIGGKFSLFSTLIVRPLPFPRLKNSCPSLPTLRDRWVYE